MNGFEKVKIKAEMFQSVCIGVAALLGGLGTLKNGVTSVDERVKAMNGSNVFQRNYSAKTSGYYDTAIQKMTIRDEFMCLAVLAMSTFATSEQRHVTGLQMRQPLPAWASIRTRLKV